VLGEETEVSGKHRKQLHTDRFGKTNKQKEKAIPMVHSH
jgi:hypothetical protein